MAGRAGMSVRSVDGKPAEQELQAPRADELTRWFIEEACRTAATSASWEYPLGFALGSPPPPNAPATALAPTA